MGKNNQIVVRPKGMTNNQLKRAAAQIGKDALIALVKSNGSTNVAYEIARGGVNLSRAAASWWAQRTASVPQDIVLTEAPGATGAAVRGSAKFNGNIRIKHRELVQANVANAAWRINPVDGSTFPYLSTLATMFDKYKFHSLNFVVVSASSTIVDGRWYCSWDPDSEDLPPVTQSDAMAVRDSLSMPRWQSGNLPVRCDKTVKYCSFKTDALKDTGRFTMFPSGAQDLYVEYDVELMDPQNSSAVTVFGGSTVANSIAVKPSTRMGNDFVVALGNGQYEVSNGFYQFSWYLKGTTLLNDPPQITNGSMIVRRSLVGTTEAGMYGIIDANLPGVTVLQLVVGGASVAGSSMTFTRISRSQYDFIATQTP